MRCSMKRSESPARAREDSGSRSISTPSIRATRRCEYSGARWHSCRDAARSTAPACKRSQAARVRTGGIQPLARSARENRGAGRKRTRAITCADADATRSSQKLERCYGANNYDTLPVVLVRGRGAHLWDANGRRYLDLMSAYSAVSLGHCHPRLVAAMYRQARTLAVTSRAYFNTCLPVLLERLCRLTVRIRRCL